MVNPAAAIALLFTNVLLSIDDMYLRLIIDMIDGLKILNLFVKKVVLHAVITAQTFDDAMMLHIHAKLKNGTAFKSVTGS